MSDKRTFILAHDLARKNAIECIKTSPQGYKVTIEPPKRSDAQNAMLWSILGDLSKQCDWIVDGKPTKLIPEDVKHILTAGLKRHQRMAIGLEGGIVILGQSTSKMSVAEMKDLITLAHAFGSERGVQWSVTSLGRDGQ